MSDGGQTALDWHVCKDLEQNDNFPIIFFMPGVYAPHI